MSRRGVNGRCLFYTQMPRRRIVGRFTEVINGNLAYPVAMIELECGHTDLDRGQKAHMWCWQCPKVGKQQEGGR